MGPVVKREPSNLSPWLGKFVGVVSPQIFLEAAAPKQLLLMFDAIALDLSAGAGMIAARGFDAAVRADIDWLASAGLLSTLEGMAAGQQRVRPAGISITGGDLLRPVLGRRTDTLRQFAVTARAAAGARHTAGDLRSKYGIDAVALPEGIPRDLDARASRDDVIRIVLNEFPYPSEITPWEMIMDYRGDPVTRAQWFRLKSWINEVAAGETKVIDFIDHLHERLQNYEDTMKQHQLTYRKGLLEVVLSTAAAVAENLVKIKWENAVRKGFEIRRHKLELLAAERDIPGRAVAYIVNTKARFQ